MQRWLRLYPELERFERHERRAALRRARREARSLRGILIMVAACGVLGGLVVLVWEWMAMPWPVMLPQWLKGGIGGFVVGTSIGHFDVRIIRKPIQRSLRRQLNASGRPICVVCGYDLRGQVEARCPECGRSFDAGLLDKTRGP